MLKTFDKIFNYGKEPITHVGGMLYNVGLISYDNFEGCSRKVVRVWPGLRFELVMKYQWYFRRIAALYQLQHPRKITGFEISRYESAEAQKITDQILLENKIKSAKAKITQANNELAKLRKGWKELFPVEDHPKWKATEKKLLEKQSQLAIMERQLENM